MGKNQLRTYSQMIKLPTFQERFKYLSLNGRVGKETFGHDRHLNQMLYQSYAWRHLRDQIILRDDGCDLAFPGREIYKKATIHHINPITIEDVLNGSWKVFDPDNLVLVSYDTHQAIHYGNDQLLELTMTERKPNDTCPWKE